MAAYIYWDSTRAGTTAIGTGSANANVKGKTSAQLQAGLPTGLTSPIWGESATTNDGLPYLIGITP